jgi:hypothetical protein
MAIQQKANFAGNKQNEQSLEKLVEGLRLNEDSLQESNNYDGEGGDSSSD